MIETILNYPYRSPLKVAEVLKDIIKDKVVCDVGCACGDLMFEFSKYCKSVLGVEHDKDRLNIAISRGFCVTKNIIPEADIYYVWVGDWGLPDVMEKLKGRKGKLILAEEDRRKELGGYEIEFPFDELAKEEADNYRKTWHLQIVEL